jgi:hypothetical protein
MECNGVRVAGEPQELVNSLNMEPYIRLAMAGLQGAVTTDELEEIKLRSHPAISCTGCVANANFLACFATGNIAGTPVKMGFGQKHCIARLFCSRYLQHIRIEGSVVSAMFSLELRRDAKEGMNETLLPDIALRQPPDLPFPDHMHRLVTVDRP